MFDVASNTPDKDKSSFTVDRARVKLGDEVKFTFTAVTNAGKPTIGDISKRLRLYHKDLSGNKYSSIACNIILKQDNIYEVTLKTSIMGTENYYFNFSSYYTDSDSDCSPYVPVTVVGAVDKDKSDIKITKGDLIENSSNHGEFVVTLMDSAGDLLGDIDPKSIIISIDAANHQNLDYKKAFDVSYVSVDKDKAEYKYEVTSLLADKYTIHVKVGGVDLTKTAVFDVASDTPDKDKSGLTVEKAKVKLGDEVKFTFTAVTKDGRKITDDLTGRLSMYYQDKDNKVWGGLKEKIVHKGKNIYEASFKANMIGTIPYFMAFTAYYTNGVYACSHRVPVTVFDPAAPDKDHAILMKNPDILLGFNFIARNAAGDYITDDLTSRLSLWIVGGNNPVRATIEYKGWIRYEITLAELPPRNDVQYVVGYRNDAGEIHDASNKAPLPIGDLPPPDNNPDPKYSTLTVDSHDLYPKGSIHAIFRAVNKYNVPINVDLTSDLHVHCGHIRWPLPP